jgi:hypothetical protein
MDEEITRRKFFSELCSKDTAKTVLGAWYGFAKEVKKKKVISPDEAGLLLARRIQSIKDSRKEG